MVPQGPLSDWGHSYAMAEHRGTELFISPFIKHLPQLIKATVSFNLKDGTFNCFTIGCITMSWIYIITIDLLALFQKDVTDIVFIGKAHEITLFLYGFTLSPALIIHRKKVKALMNYILEDFKDAQTTPAHTAVVKEFMKFIDLFGKVFLVNIVGFVGVVFNIFLPLILLVFFTDKTKPVREWPLPVGYIPLLSESYVVYGATFFVGGSAMGYLTAFHFCSCVLIFYSAFKIKAMMKMLALNLGTLDETAEERWRALENLHLSLKGQTKAKEEKLNELVEDRLKELIQDHLEIMRYVKVLDVTFRSTVFSYLFMVIPLTVLPAGRVTDATRNVQGLFVQSHLLFSTLLSMLFLAYCGEIIPTESENLCNAMYYCNWTDKSPRFKSTLLVMMTVATKPLVLTIGGLYPLRIHTCTTTMQAVFSYLNFMITMRRKRS